jgi:hypothetical protein
MVGMVRESRAWALLVLLKHGDKLVRSNGFHGAETYVGLRHGSIVGLSRPTLHLQEQKLVHWT